MNSHRTRVACMLLACALGLSACEKSAPPPQAVAPAAPAPPPAPTVNAELQRLAAEVWVFAFPLVLTDVTREVQTAGMEPNEFVHRQAMPGPTSTEAFPNADFLYSYAWLDLTDGPVILTVPDTRGRYYLLALLDAYTNVAGSIGKRTTGTEKREFALVGPRYKGPAPEGTSEVRLPTDLAWIFARTAVEDKSDLKKAIKVQEQYELATAKKPAKGRDRKKGKQKEKDKEKEAPPPATQVDTKTPPREQVAAMDAKTFFTRVAMLLPENPPAKDDAPMLEKIKMLGIEPGKPFDMSKLSPLDARSVEQGIKQALSAVVTASKGLSGADIRNGWRIDRALGRWGTEYGRRAIAAYNGLGVNAPEDALFMSTYLDSGGRKLDGANRYVMHFDKGMAPPTDAFWSLSLYDEQGHFVANPQNRYNIGSEDPIKTNPDGSLDIYVSNGEPPKGKEANWLPAPKGPFNVILRIYWPKPDVIEGRWNPPGLQPAA